MVDLLVDLMAETLVDLWGFLMAELWAVTKEANVVGPMAVSTV